MPDPATVDAGGAAPGEGENLERVRSSLEAFNEVVRAEGDLLAWEQEYFDPQAEYRPIEDRDWFRDPHAITRSVARWVETWGVGTHRITPEHILEFGDDCFLVTAHNSGVGRRSGVPIEATTYMASRWRDGKIVWFDEYLDRERALAVVAPQTSTAGAEPDAQVALGELVWRLGEAAFGAFVRRRSDRQLERIFGSDPAQRAIFKRMEQLFEPAKADGFAGEIQCELRGPKGVKKWVVRIDHDRALTRAGESPAPAATLRSSLPIFVRVAAREVHPVKAYREGWVEVEGEFALAARFNVMFGLSK